MGQYYLTVNLDKREFLDPHKLGDGLKLWEQLNSTGGVMAALHILLACSNGRGGGDIEEHPLVGRWAGDRIAVVGDYAEDSDLAPEHHAESIYDLCRLGQDPQDRSRIDHYRTLAQQAKEKPDWAQDYERQARYLETAEPYRDISDEILPLVEAACDVSITGKGWRDKKEGRQASTVAMRPDMILSLKPREEGKK